MTGIPTWIWGILGGLLLGVVGLLILWPACGKGAQALLKRFVISLILKLFLAAAGFWLGIKLLHLDPVPLVIGFMIGYLVSMFLEILPCIWKIRRCVNDTPSAE